MGLVLLWVSAATSQIEIPAHSPPVNFRIVGTGRSFLAENVRKECDAWRAKLVAHWGLPSPDQWSPPCEVFIHADRGSYRSAVGPGGDATFGSSSIEFKGRDVSRRRLDLLPDARGELSALGHELTHVILADGFGGRQPPRWFDEGIAVLADHRDKQNRHLQDVSTALAQRTAFSVGELMSLDRYPGANRMGAFYGQSFSLTLLLSQHDAPEKLIPFMQHAFEHGYDDALRKVYRIEGVAGLQMLWRKYQLAAKPYGALRTAAR